MTPSFLAPLAATAGLLAFGAAPAAAEPAVGLLAGTNVLASFDTATPGTYTNVRQITGLGVGERIRGLDFRHAAAPGIEPAPLPRMFALSVQNMGANDRIRVYTIDTATGVATQVGSFFQVPAGEDYGFDFNPSSDRIRVVNDVDDNLRINPNSGARADSPVEDTNVTPIGALVTAVAHDRVHLPPTLPSIPANTTAYAIERNGSNLVTIGSVNQTPNSANTGGVQLVGSLTITLGGTDAELNFDISPGGTAYLTANALGQGSGLYTVNLATGAATPIAPLPAALDAFAIVPASSVQFDATAATVAEGESASLAVSRTGAPGETVTVGYATSDGSATGADYTPTHGTLTFGPGETSKTIAVPTSQDTADEPDETLTVTLSSPSAPTTLGAQSATTVTITDDDAPPPSPTPSPTPTPTPQPAPPDLTAPTATLTGVGSSVTLANFLKGLRLAVTPNEPATIEAELLATVTGARISAYNLKLASRSLPLAAGRRTITLKPSRRLVGTPRRTVKVRLRVTLTDASRNRRTLTKTVSVRAPRRR